MAHHHHHPLAAAQALPAPPVARVATHPAPAPILVFPPAVATARAWGEPLMCAALTLVCFNRTLRRLSVRVTDWGVAARGMVWAILAYALFADLVISTGTSLAVSLALSSPRISPWLLAVLMEAVALMLASGFGGMALAYYFRSRVRRAGGGGPFAARSCSTGGAGR